MHCTQATSRWAALCVQNLIMCQMTACIALVTLFCNVPRLTAQIVSHQGASACLPKPRDQGTHEASVGCSSSWQVADGWDLVREDYGEVEALARIPRDSFRGVSIIPRLPPGQVTMGLYSLLGALGNVLLGWNRKTSEASASFPAGPLAR